MQCFNYVSAPICKLPPQMKNTSKCSPSLPILCNRLLGVVFHICAQQATNPTPTVIGTCSQCSPLNFKRCFYTIQMTFFPPHRWFCQRFPLKKEQVPLSFQTTKLALLIPGKHTLATQDILLSSYLFTKPYNEESVINMKPPRTFGETECHCEGGPWPSHRNQHFCTEKHDEILLDKWPDPPTYIPFKSY